MSTSSRARYRGTVVRPGVWGAGAVVCLVLMTGCSSAPPALRKVVQHPSPSPTAAPVPGKLAFSDSFVSAKAGWAPPLYGSGSYPPGGGYLVIAEGGANAYSESPFSSTVMDGVAVSASGVEQSGDPHSGYFGVGCDLGDPDPRYEFVVDAAGNYSITVADTSYFNVVSAGHVASMHAVGLTNEIEGSCTHGALTDGAAAVALRLSINGVSAASVIDTSSAEETTWGGGVVVESPDAAGPVVSVLFSAFSMTDLATPATLGTNPVVYSDSMGNTDTGWDTHRWNANEYVAYGAGVYDIKANGWVEASAPQIADTLTAAHFTATAKVVGGALETYSGVFCTSSINSDPQYIFFASPNGRWQIAGLPNDKRAPVALLNGHFATPPGAAKTVTVGGSCIPVSNGGGHYTTRLVISVDGKQVGSTKAVASGTQHSWVGGLMIVTFQGDPAATVAFTNFSAVQLAP